MQAPAVRGRENWSSSWGWHRALPRGYHLNGGHRHTGMHAGLQEQ